jgi:DNA-binding MarR family transcriptional regulator
VPAPSAGRPGGGVAFLLAQLGSHAAERFAERIGELGLTPPQAGILSAISAEPGRSQQALSEQLGLIPSRVVAFVDDLEARGLVERRRNATDRRLYALHLTADGATLMRSIGQVARKHEQEFTAALTREQRANLADLLTGIATRQALTPGGYPDYRAIGRRRIRSAPASAG